MKMVMNERVQDMCLLAFRHLPGLALISFLLAMLASPVNAQNNFDSSMQWIGSARAHGQLELNGSLMSPSLAGPNNVTPTAKAEDAARKVESKITATQPKSTLGAKKAGSGIFINKAGSRIVINIDKTNQKMTVFLDGIEKYEWPVSTGKAGYSTPSGTYAATSMNEIWYSKQWDNAPMPHSIFFMKDGHAIHGSNEVKNLGNPASHGCVRISPENAATLYALVAKNGLQNTQVVLTGSTPGGEFKVARPAGAARYSQADVGAYENVQLQTRTGFFERLFGGPYYNGQGYYAQPRAFYQR
jgi:lipoprotein-anchoring transpeptidase ErfK/SrfK